ncbi:hypothetical protein [Sphingobium chungbukense]|uniref:Uncharacterized protein n=1 Tax=Sphingobium chungbukense TaxID=56193 RepID=A0A0M3AW26_9SPHN|nr:hypothetical protein [Sphingobium chungbukense]KKW93116.1 hypothetical protein YP76_05785 [Sphingobium chungbukense]
MFGKHGLPLAPATVSLSSHFFLPVTKIPMSHRRAIPECSLEKLAQVLAGMFVKALHRHRPMRRDGAWPLGAYDATKMTARTAAFRDNMRKKRA